MTDARDALTLARPLEAETSSCPASTRLLLPALCACHGSYGCQIERVVKMIWQSSDAASTERSRESSIAWMLRRVTSLPHSGMVYRPTTLILDHWLLTV
jgi:hypothetical protein